MNTKHKDFYVYLHRRATDGSVFYVGKGTANRAYAKVNRSIYWKRIVDKRGFFVEFYETGLQEWYALELEIQLIAYYGRENLCNLTDGGDGTSGMKHSKETKEKISKLQTGRKQSADLIEKRRQKMIGRKQPKSFIKKVGKPVLCSNGMEFESLASARNWLITQGIMNPGTCSISNCARGVNKHAYWYGWEFKSSGKLPTHPKMVMCLENEMLFKNCYEAAKWLKTIGFEKASFVNISTCCRGERVRAYGFTWKYI